MNLRPTSEQTRVVRTAEKEAVACSGRQSQTSIQHVQPFDFQSEQSGVMQAEWAERILRVTEVAFA